MLKRNVRNIRWSISKQGEWYDACFSIPPLKEITQVLIDEFPNHKALFTNKYNWLDYLKEFKKNNINYEIIQHSYKGIDSALVALKDIEFLFCDQNYWEFCFFIVPDSIANSKKVSLPNRDFENEITGSDLEQLDFQLLLWNNDNREIMLTTKNKKVLDSHLIPLFRWILENTKLNSLEMFTDEFILQIMNQEDSSVEVSNQSFKQHDDGSISFQLWNSCYNPSSSLACTVIVKDNDVTYSEWERRKQSETPYNVENRKGQIGCWIVVVLVLLGFVLLIIMDSFTVGV